MSQTQPAPLGLRNICILLMVAFLWGSNNVAAHLTSQDIHPLMAAGARFIITALLLLPWIRVPKEQRAIVLLIAAVGGPLHFGFIYMGFARSENIGALTVVIQFWVPLSTLLAIVWLNEYPTKIQSAGLCMALVGILIMCFDPHLIDDAAAALYCFGATICWAITMVLTRRAAVLSGASLQAWMAVLTGPTLFLAGWMADPIDITTLGALSQSFWLLTLYAAVGSGVLGNVMVFNIVRRHTVAQTTPLLLCAPIFAMICGIIFLNEKLGFQEVIGAGLVLASVLVIVRGNANA
jgi:O-acetylserine/cysteine efflux transporter